MNRCNEKNCIFVVGMGPGGYETMTHEANRAIEESELVVGYSVYTDLIKEMFPDKEYYSTPMTKEEERCVYAFREAKKGIKVSVVCSGDAGIYGMAGLMLELEKNYPEIEVIIVPGVTAAISGAAVLGAPLSNDFCVISLSDRLTPWTIIEKRLRAAAMGDFPIVLYNPSSRTRRGYLEKACQILLETIEPARICGYVKNIGREGQTHKQCWLRELIFEEKAGNIDMFTTVFIGNSNTIKAGEKIVTKRGYDVE